jgi:hypothetical protein
MPFVLTVNSQIRCAHNAPVQLSSTAKLTVGGAKALLQSEVVGASIPTCPNPTDNKGDKKCTMVATAGGTAAKLTVGGQAVLNDTFAGTSDGATPPAPVPMPLTLVTVGHTKLSAV